MEDNSRTVKRNRNKEEIDEPIMSQNTLVGKAIETKNAINAYFKGEITISELNARGIKFVNTI